MRCPVCRSTAVRERFRLKLNTTNLEPIELERESGKFKGAWHHAAAVLGGAAAAPMR
jgi:hypothetical protein